MIRKPSRRDLEEEFDMKRLAAIVSTAMFVSILTFVPGCAAQNVAQPDTDARTAVDTEAMQGVVGTPPLQPADHADRAQDPASRCYGCHGAGSLANPQLADATILPEDHYVDGTYDSRKIVPTREQCITCHPVA